jgi:hypothetical protein
LLKLAIETENQLDPEKLSSNQASLLLEGLRRIDLDVQRKAQFEIRVAFTGDDIHDSWRKRSPVSENWKPTDAKLWNGEVVSSPYLLKEYLLEKGIPEDLHKYYKLNQTNGKTQMWEDIKNLPNNFLANNHQEENRIAALTAIELVDRIWDKGLVFKDAESFERWLIGASQVVHKKVLKRNTNGAQDRPELNVHWLDLKARFKMNDFQTIRSALETRFRLNPRGLGDDQKDLLTIGLEKFEAKINAFAEGSCDFIYFKKSPPIAPQGN